MILGRVAVGGKGGELGRGEVCEGRVIPFKFEMMLEDWPPL